MAPKMAAKGGIFLIFTKLCLFLVQDTPNFKISYWNLIFDQVYWIGKGEDMKEHWIGAGEKLGRGTLICAPSMSLGGISGQE